MNTENENMAAGASSQGPTAAGRLPARMWQQVLLLTLGAVGLYLGMRALPTGTNLHPRDFRVEGKGALEYCDPANPQFVPVLSARSPVTMAVRGGASRSGQPVTLTVMLATSSGKPLGPEDFLVSHTQLLHLLLIDPTLHDYQHLHPVPGERPGEWTFTFTPWRVGTYRVFADFTPRVTARSLYASADWEVLPAAVEVAAQAGAGAGHRGEAGTQGTEMTEGTKRGTATGAAVKAPVAAGQVVAVPAAVLEHAPFALEVVRAGYRFQLALAGPPLRAGQAAELRFGVQRAEPGGGPVQLEPVMDALAHLVAFDSTRSGFAHLHPGAVDAVLSATHPQLEFKLTVPEGGRYVIWAQVRIDGREHYLPFALEAQVRW